jgi:hypothetical protein
MITGARVAIEEDKSDQGSTNTRSKHVMRRDPDPNSGERDGTSTLPTVPPETSPANGRPETTPERASVSSDDWH